MKKKIVIASFLFFLAWIILPSFGCAAETDPNAGIHLRQGEVAPAEGYLFTDGGLVRLINKLQAVDTMEKRLGIVQEELVLTKEQVEQLKEAARNDMVSRALADQIIGNQKQERELFMEILNQYRLSNTELREDLKASRNETFWAKVFGAIGPIGLIIYGIAHGF